MGPVLSVALFVGVGLGFVLLNLLVGKLVRPNLPHAVKKSIYECGEVAVGSSWVQFDLRFYIVALFYLVFDVEVALLYPWASIFRQIPTEAMLLGLPFLLIVVVGFAYEWYAGSLEWIRGSSHGQAPRLSNADDLSALARRDPETLAESTATSR